MCSFRHAGIDHIPLLRCPEKDSQSKDTIWMTHLGHINPFLHSGFFINLDSHALSIVAGSGPTTREE
jgi:hypothetical protein